MSQQSESRARRIDPEIPIRIGCAGWTIPAAHRATFPPDGTHLEHYSGVFSSVEINSSFYRPHRRQTYARWAESVGPDFAFSVKVPREITHEYCLADCGALVEEFLQQVSGLGDKLGALLVQLPASFAFDPGTARQFFREFRRGYSGALVCEPRSATWFSQEADELLAEHRVDRVAADPAPVPSASEPAPWSELAYFRLHGSPRMYYSEYSPAWLEALAARVREWVARGRATWCIFDNTALEAATPNALALAKLLNLSGGRSVPEKRRGTR